MNKIIEWVKRKPVIDPEASYRQEEAAIKEAKEMPVPMDTTKVTRILVDGVALNVTKVEVEFVYGHYNVHSELRITTTSEGIKRLTEGWYAR